MKYLTNSGLSYFFNKIKTYLTSSTYLNSIGIFPNTDNSVDLGDSSKNIKMIYTKGITINGTQLSSNGITVDSTLDGTSSNAVSNSAVSNALDGKSDVGHTHTVSDVTDFPTLATVATSGSYNDLSNKPTTMTPTSHTHGNITNDGKIGSNANKPLITTTGGTVTTGSFGTSANTFCEGNDSRLSDARTPTSHTHTKSEITDFPSLAKVATSGSYNDLSNKPTIPTVNNATLTIQKNGTTVKTFTANASSNVTANITVPTKVSELNNDRNFVRSLNNYMDLSWDTPVSGKLNIKVDQAWLGGILTTANTTIPTKTSDLTNDSGFLTSHQDLSGYVPRSGGAIMTGDSLGRTVDNVEFRIDGGNGWGKGASVVVRGKDKSTDGGSLILHTQDSNGLCQMILKPDGTATWGSKKIDTIEEQGDGYIRYSNGLQICWGVIKDVQLEPFNGHYGKLVSYPKSFLANTYPIVNISQWRETGNLTQNFNMYIVTESYVGIETDNGWGVYYTVFGMWK